MYVLSSVGWSHPDRTDHDLVASVSSLQHNFFEIFKLYMNQERTQMKPCQKAAES